MRIRRAAEPVLAALLVAAPGWAPGARAAEPCDAPPGWHAARIAGHVEAGHSFVGQVGDWTLVLGPAEHGGRIGVLDADGLDAPVFAPPLRPVETNPLTIAGWHFRNAANTGPNIGDVNAPQHRRRFSFGTLAAGQAAGAGTVPPGDPAANGGLGELAITGLRLTPPGQGGRAAILRMDFETCILWTRPAVRHPPIVDPDPAVAFAAAVAEMRGCGLDTDTHAPTDRMVRGGRRDQPPALRPDIDGDNIPDLALLVVRRADGAPGLAICLVGDETLVLAGYDGRIGRHLDPVDFARADWWSVHHGPIRPGAGEGSPPAAAGDAILLGKEDSSSVLVLLDRQRRVTSYWQGD